MQVIPCLNARNLYRNAWFLFKTVYSVLGQKSGMSRTYRTPFRYFIPSWSLGPFGVGIWYQMILKNSISQHPTTMSTERSVKLVMRNAWAKRSTAAQKISSPLLAGCYPTRSASPLWTGLSLPLCQLFGRGQLVRMSWIMSRGCQLILSVTLLALSITASVFTGEIISCAGWRLNHLPELRRFLKVVSKMLS